MASAADRAVANDFVSEDQRRIAARSAAHRARQKQSLNLQREKILSQRTSNPGTPCRSRSSAEGDRSADRYAELAGSLQSDDCRASSSR